MRKLSVWELSRLGRNTLEVLKTIEEFNTLGISLFIKKYNIETLNEDGKPNVMSQFLVLKSAISRQAKVNKFSLVFWLNEIVPLRRNRYNSYPIYLDVNRASRLGLLLCLTDETKDLH